MIPARTLIVGIGSPHGCDQAGWLIAERLAGELDQSEVIVRKAMSPAELLDWLDGIAQLIICDACRGLGRIGKLRRWTWPAHELEQALWSGTHDLSLPTVLHLADRLGRLPQHVTVWSVEGTAGHPLASIAPDVASALSGLVDEIKNEVARGTDANYQQCTNIRS